MIRSAPERADVVLGLIPLTDCAPLAVAVERGFFADEGLRVTTSRERSWAAVRDKVAYGVLDGAQMIAPMLLATTLGVNGVRRPLLTGVSLGLNGNAVTLSVALSEAVEAAAPATAGTAPLSAEGVLAEVRRRERDDRPRLRFGIVFGGSTHEFELRYWLAAAGVDPDHDVELIVVPPPRMAAALAAGELDGFCVGEPWNSVAVAEGVGRVAITKRQLQGAGPEKVLGVTAGWAERHPATHAALIRAIVAAARWVQAEENRDRTAEILAQPQYVGEPAEIIARSLRGRFRTGREPLGVPPTPDASFHVFAGEGVNRPDRRHAVWFLLELLRWGMLKRPLDVGRVAAEVYRDDLFDAATGEAPRPPAGGDAVAEATLRLFDGRGPDPARPLDYLAGCGLHRLRVPLPELLAANAG
ncbi:CmpA/NrtA family ABC transporter substrate-binding protein [Phycisphaera mikurensis]|uniref:Putative nitrate binding protein n=1 Tax=Phycisphaera mikurensis (strain NBRC 102666 / KCTC 22515 / FYK2301M01) TaxID=1142394 RepID=I0IG04_PHYMF|nr:CmpA/NrtA family ABC transporter substrate-binding protein [Phycisphaera mikurensis]MBB6440422.1 nitrate/nitrite transport system substrate-binding protein [Phycisphaera mikurensis]BAM04192.1 putative nitrate binding protein [Phycisphaera mikurensis NBRC 102666]